MLTLYHFGGAICAQKVRIALAEKGLDWQSKDSSHALRDPEYLKLNPSGVVPTLVHDGAVIRESRIISEYIDDAFDGPVLMPYDPVERHRARLWSKQIDDALHLNIFILTFAMSAREDFLQMAPETRVVLMPGLQDSVKRGVASEILETGMASPWVGSAITRFRRMLTEMEEQLGSTSYLAGTEYSLADADYTAYLNRLIDLGLCELETEYPRLCGWWRRMKSRPSFNSAISDWATPKDNRRYEIARQRYGDDIKVLMAAR